MVKLLLFFLCPPLILLPCDICQETILFCNCEDMK